MERRVDRLAGIERIHRNRLPPGIPNRNARRATDHQVAEWPSTPDGLDDKGLGFSNEFRRIRLGGEGNGRVKMRILPRGAEEGEEPAETARRERESSSR